MNYRGNTYSGPAYFCQNCDEAHGSEAYADKHRKLGHCVFAQSRDRPHPCFLKGLTIEGHSMPCLFNRSGPAAMHGIREAIGATFHTLEEREQMIAKGIHSYSILPTDPYYLDVVTID